LFFQVLLIGGALALVLWLIIRLTIVTAPMMVGFFIAYALNPVVVWLRKHRVPAVVALTVPLLAVIGLGVVLMVFVVPNLAAELLIFSQKLPGRLQRLMLEVDPYWERIFAVKLSGLVEPAVLRANLQTLGRELVGPASSVVGWVLTSARDLLVAVINVMLVFVVAAFLIDDYERIVQQGMSLVPRNSRARVERLLRDVDTTLKGFIRGELLLFTLASTAFTSGLLVLDVGFAALIGPLVAVIYLVPYIGMVFGTLLALAVAMLEAPSLTTFIGVLAVFMSFYIIDLLFITPKVIGGRVGLRPLAVFLGVMAGGHLFGVVGVLLAIPGLAVGRIVLVELLASYRKSSTYLGDGDSTLPPST
jgi:predicted PurR-regulated permease PerM